MISVRPGTGYRYSAEISPGDSVVGAAQVRFLWLDRALNVIAWNDSPNFKLDSTYKQFEFYAADYVAPEGAAYLRFSLKNTDDLALLFVRNLSLSQTGVYIEPHPNGTQGSLAFSFDWESAMGGPIHSKGMTDHDPAQAEREGLAMRAGADWLSNLFAQHNIKATFYGTGYNLLDGNTVRRPFAGNPTYRWASPRNGWSSEYWLTQPWYGDDPFGTVQTHPAWYFGDQTRRLLASGHEIAPHTFGHIYVRGSNPADLAADADEWLTAARAIGLPTPTTFAFPWRSSNSLTPDFYKVLHDRGITAVTRIYERDLKDLYTIGAAPVYSDIAVMPDFLLGRASTTTGEESAGQEIIAAEGLAVITETLSRRGTTSFWQHPDQLGGAPELNEVRDAWQTVVSSAARERDNGRLNIATVADIVAYQRDVLSITATLNHDLQGWTLRVNNALDKPISGVTLTLPGDAAYVFSTQVDVRTVHHPQQALTRVSDRDKPVYPARQLVLNDLKPGASSIRVEWLPGQEPLR